MKKLKTLVSKSAMAAAAAAALAATALMADGNGGGSFSCSAGQTACYHSFLGGVDAWCCPSGTICYGHYDWLGYRMDCKKI